MKFLSLNRKLAVDFLVDFVREETGKFGFSKVVLGLSGGIDSALSAALGVRALGPEGVLAIAMPHADSAPDSLADAKLVAEHLGIELVQQSIPREMLYLADEIFLTGTAAEVTPVRSIDRIKVGTGKRGEMTRQIQDAFFGIFDGKTADRWGWLEPVRFDDPVANIAV